MKELQYEAQNRCQHNEHRENGQQHHCSEAVFLKSDYKLREHVKKFYDGSEHSCDIWLMFNNLPGTPSEFFVVGFPGGTFCPDVRQIFNCLGIF